MQEMQFQPLSLEDSLEEKMVTHCGNLAWEIPCIEEHGHVYGVTKDLDKTWQLNNNSPLKKYIGFCDSVSEET